MKRQIAVLLIALMTAFSVFPAFAAENTGAKIILEDVTSLDPTTLEGEAKIKVSVEGVSGNVSIAQLYMDFEGGLRYKSITYLTGSNNPAQGSALISPNAAVANSEKRIATSIINTKTPISFDGRKELFVLTFSGNAGDAVTLQLKDLKNSYFTIGGKDITPSAAVSIENVKASASANKGKKAAVKLTMDKVTAFNGAYESGAYSSSGLELRITGENGYEFYTILNNIPVQKGGHRDATQTIPTFLVSDTVVDGQAYTVELSGIGYVSYKKTGVTFDSALEITNADFIPGDVNGDGKVDGTDKQLCQAAVDNPAEASEATDFTRDGKTDKYDMAVFDGIGEDKAVPAKMARPTVTGGEKKITVSWTKPSDETVTGYVIKYGTTKDNMNKEVTVDNAGTTSKEITSLSADTTYYASVAAKNANGVGEFSDAVSASTNKGSDGTGGGGGGTGGGGGGSTGGGSTGGGFGGSTGGSIGGNTGVTPPPVQNGEVFTDLDNYSWAKDSIYALKEKGIISGTSDTTYSPANNIKRGDFILILTRMLGINNEFTENFADVPAESYYYQAIGMAKAAGVASGDGVNFMPENSITRQDLITLAYRAFLAKGYITEQTDASSLDVFADKDSISEYARTSMASMVAAGIIQGSDGNVNPLGNATRAEVAVMCARLVNLMK